MDKSRHASRVYKGIAIAVPLLLLIAAVTVSQVYLMRAADDPTTGQDLQLLGYGLNGTSLTLSNVGKGQLTILSVAYDGRLLTQGTIGGTTPMFSMGENSFVCYAPTNDLIFPQGEHWNMDTGGLCTPTILPSGLATLYLGVFSAKPLNHTVVIHTQAGDFVFTITPSE